jgi:hypothetical protein
MKTWKTPEILRLCRIEEWAKQRYERRTGERDIAAAMRAANFYETIARRADGVALDSALRRGSGPRG